MFFQLNLLPERRRKDGRTKCLAIEIQFHPHKKIKMNNLVVSISLCFEDGLGLCYLKE